MIFTIVNGLIVTNDITITEDDPAFDNAIAVTSGINYVAFSFYDTAGNGNYEIRIYAVDPNTKALTLDATIQSPDSWEYLNTNPSVQMNNVVGDKNFGNRLMFWGREGYEILAVFFRDNDTNINDNPTLAKMFSAVHYTKETGTWKAMKRVDCGPSGEYYAGAARIDRSSMYATTPRVVMNCDDEIHITKLNPGSTYTSIVTEHARSGGSSGGMLRPHIQSPQMSGYSTTHMSSVTIAPDSKKIMTCYANHDQCRVTYNPASTTAAYIFNMPSRYDGTSYSIFGGMLLSDDRGLVIMYSTDLQEVDEIIQFDASSSSTNEVTGMLFPYPDSVAGTDERMFFTTVVHGPAKDFLSINEYKDFNDRSRWVYRVSDFLATDTLPSEVVKIQNNGNTAASLTYFETGANNTAMFGTNPGSVATFGYVTEMIPPTPAPTASPTPAPTYECIGSSQCIADTEVCGPGNTCELADSCTANIDCYGDFVSGHLPFCNKITSKCKDLGLSGTCSNAKQCAAATSKQLSATLGLMTAKRTVTSAKRFNATSELITRAKAQLAEGVAPVIIVKNTETGTFSSQALDEVGQEVFLNGIKAEICKDYDGLCTVSIVEERRMLGERRDLQSSSSVTVEIEYEVDDSAYEEISGGSLEADGFEAALAAQLGIHPDNVTVTAVEGQLVVSITLLEEESSNGDPSGEEIVSQIQAIEDDLTDITSDLVTELGLDPADIESSALDLCVGRTCNGRGTCNEETGLCECEGEWWGVNCETECTCLGSSGTSECKEGYCICQFPEYGQRCEFNSTCLDECNI